jgi:hypothetical protein
MLIACIDVQAQVEVFRNTEDTSTYINPKDTITTAPRFENGDMDFLRYIETHMTALNVNSTLSYASTNIKCSFYIDKDGSVSDYKLITFSDANIAHELERVITKMPKWTPGVYLGKTKRTLMIYDLSIRRVNDFNTIQVTMRDSDLEYTTQTNPLKWFMVVGSLMILVALFVIKS